MIYLVSYDLNADSGNYAVVKETIKSLGDVKQCLESVWLVSTDLHCADIFKSINEVLNKGDRCFVCRMYDKEYCGVTLSEYKVWEWLAAKSVLCA